MSEEDFLKRWSRRKQEAKEASEPLPAPPPAEAALPSVSAEPAADELDLSKLPPIDSITAATDVTAFLRENIPLELSRAALRRAWAADPAIRDFVGLAENAWDFTDPTAMPGFGPLDHAPEQIAAMVDRVVGGMRDAIEKMAAAVPDDAQNQAIGSEMADVSATRVSAPADAALEPNAAVTADIPQTEAAAAVQPESSDDESEPDGGRRRSHGGALPT